MSYKAEIPYGAYWSTPFARWQGSFANLHSIEFAAHVAKAELAKRKIDPKAFDYGALGFSVPQKHSFYGLPWLAGLIGAGQAGGPTLMQACATGVRTLLAAAQEIEVGMASVALAINCDRTSNGPHVFYPNPKGPGGTGDSENWVMDSFNCDPLGPHAMLQTAENVAKKHGIGTPEQHELVLRREAQYRMALENDRLPQALHDPALRGTRAQLQEDRRHAVRRRRHHHLHGRRPGQAEAGDAGRQRHLRRPDASGRRQRGDRRHQPRQGARTVRRSEDRGAPARLRPRPRARGLHAGGHGAGGEAGAGPGRQGHRRHEGDQDPQPLRGE
jgi:hypothetical protein